MKLQEKTSLIFIALLIITISVISIFLTVISLSSYQALEESYTSRDVSLATSRIEDEARTLSAIVSDWAPWDDTYDFVGGARPEYVESNLLPETYANLRLNLILIVNNDGEIVYGGMYNATSNEVTAVPLSLLEHIRPGSVLTNTTDPRSGTEGILMTPDDPMLIASRPVVHTDFSGTPRGVVIMGRYLDAAEVGRLATLTDPSLELLPVDDGMIPTDILRDLRAGGAGTNPVFRVLSDTQAAGYVLFDDIYGNEALVLSIRQDRDIYRQGVMTTLQYIFIVLAAGLVLGVGVLFIIDRLVLSRIMDLSRQVSGIGTDRDVSRRIILEGDDEFSGLATVINQMLTTIEKTQDGLLASENRFRELAELLPQVIFEMDVSGRLLYVNRAGAEIFGITEEKIRQGAIVRNYMTADDISRMHRGLAAVIGGAKSSGETYSLKKADGSIMHAIIYTSPIHREGTISGFRGIVTDISERVNLEEALTESQEYLQTLLWSVQAGIVVIDAETHTIVDANPAALSMIGATKDQLVHRSCWGVICPAEAGKCPVTDQGLVLENAERSLLTLDNRTVSVIKYVVPVMLQGRACLLETFIDNTARRQIEEELRKSRGRLSGILHASPVGVFETDAGGNVVYVNERWAEMTGLSTETMNGKRWTDILHPLDRARVEKDVLERIRNHQIPREEARFIRPDGTILWVYAQAVPLYHDDGGVRGYAGTITDITDRKRDEDAISLANKKLNLMNNITRHDILNTITGLLGSVDMAKAARSETERMELLDSIKDLTRVIQRQIAFTKEYQEVGVHLPLWQNVNSVIARVRQNFTSCGIAIDVDLETTEIYADPLLEKVFYNLVDNALRYGGHITSVSFFYQISDKGLSIICQDDGAGIPPESKARIFERGVGRNTGMGLFLTREILGITGITIEENGVYGNGARFEILIPRGMFRFVRESENE